MLASQMLKTLYAPHKAFKEIIQNPKYKGAIVIIIVFVAVYLGSTYIAVSKISDEQSLPDGSKKDEWTENRIFWTSNAETSESNDSITGRFYGSNSTAFSINDSPLLWVQLKDVEPINCSTPDGYNKLSFRTKWTNIEKKPDNVTGYLLSANSSAFQINLTERFVNATTANLWNNVTVPLASLEWSANSTNAEWSHITGLKLEFAWTDNTNVTLLVDGLFFHGPFKSLVESAGSAFVFTVILSALMQFVVTWVVLSGLIYLVAKSFGGKLVWKPLLIIVSFILLTMVIQEAANAAAYSTLPAIYRPFELVGGVTGEGDPAYSIILDQTWLVTTVTSFVTIAASVWAVALCSLAARIQGELSWAKSFMIGLTSFLVTILARSFILA